jgi:hypothetical protein
MVIEPQFEDPNLNFFEYISTYTFRSGIAMVKLGGKYGCIDKNGKWIVQPVFEKMIEYLPKQNIVASAGYYYDIQGNKLNHYANHMYDGYKYLKMKDLAAAELAFKAALLINPGDEAAIFGLSKAAQQ